MDAAGIARRMKARVYVLCGVLLRSNYNITDTTTATMILGSTTVLSVKTSQVGLQEEQLVGEWIESCVSSEDLQLPRQDMC